METSLISFDDIATGATVRLTVIKGTRYLSIRDVIMHVCGKNNDEAGLVWRRMSDSKKEEVCKELAVYQFPGRGQSAQSVITLPGSIKLVMMLPGERAQRYKTQFAEIIARYLDGDQLLGLEIEGNRLAGQKRSYSQFADDVTRMVNEDDAIPQVHYIYATKSPAFPDLIKIGRTIDMRARLSSLNTACAPAPHALVAIAATFDMHRDEYLAHDFFAHSRKEGEFFQVQEEAVKAYFSSVIAQRFQQELMEFFGGAGMV